MCQWVAALALGLLASGCSVVVYQPLMGLQEPVLADLQQANLSGTQVLLSCAAADAVDARRLCQRLEPLFSNQGAVVRTQSDAPDEGVAPLPVDLRVELVGTQVEEEGGTGSAAMAYMFLNLLPLSRESTFVQDVTVRDGQGFLLASRRLEGRLIEHFGVAYWVMTHLLNWVARGPAEQIGEQASKADMSRDLYGQLCQTVIAAQVRQRAFLLSAGGG